VISLDEVDTALQRMAAVVDAQNTGDPAYRPMIGRNGSCLPLEAARQLILNGVSQPNGYTEPVLHAFRRRAKGASEVVERQRRD
jgi:malate synthase